MAKNKTVINPSKPPVKDKIINEGSLRENQRFLTTLISNLPGYVYRCHEENGKWFTQFASDGIYNLTGYNPEDFLRDGKMSYGLIVHPDDQRVLSNVVKDAIKERRPYQITYLPSFRRGLKRAL